MDIDDRHRQEPLVDRVRGRYPEPNPEHPKAVPDLERRLNDRYDERYEVPYLHPSSTSNPPSRRDRENYPDDLPRHADHHHRRPHAYANERRSPAWTEAERRADTARPPVPDQYVERGRGYEGGKTSVSPPDGAASTRKPRIRRFGPPLQTHPEANADVQPNDTRPVDRHLDDDSRRPQADYDRGPVSRRGASLLDRLSSADVTTGVSDAMASASLRDRVLIPSKRDREEMLSSVDAVAVDVAFDMDDTGDSRKSRRRSGKTRKGKGRTGGN